LNKIGFRNGQDSRHKTSLSAVRNDHRHDGCHLGLTEWNKEYLWMLFVYLFVIVMSAKNIKHRQTIGEKACCYKWCICQLIYLKEVKFQGNIRYSMSAIRPSWRLAMSAVKSTADNLWFILCVTTFMSADVYNYTGLSKLIFCSTSNVQRAVESPIKLPTNCER